MAGHQTGLALPRHTSSLRGQTLPSCRSVKEPATTAFRPLLGELQNVSLAHHAKTMGLIL